MIAPSVSEMLSAVIHTVEREIAPKIARDDDGYAASLCRTVGQMLRSAQCRIECEEASLTEDNAELHALLVEWAPCLPKAERDEVASLVSAAVDPPARTVVEGLSCRAVRLREALTVLIGAFDDTDSPPRRAARAYLRHQVEREERWMVDAFTGPRR